MMSAGHLFVQLEERLCISLKLPKGPWMEVFEGSALLRFQR